MSMTSLEKRILPSRSCHLGLTMKMSKHQRLTRNSTADAARGRTDVECTLRK